MGIKQRCAGSYTRLLRLYLGMLAFVALCAAVVMGAEGIRLGALALGCVCVLLCAGVIVVPMGRSVTYARSGGCLSIERGWWIRRRLIVNRSDIRYAEISGSPLERHLGICTVTFFTGGGKVRLRGIHTDDGQRLRYLFGGEAAD